MGVTRKRRKRTPPKIEKTSDGGFKMKIRDWRDLRDFMTIAYPQRRHG